MPQPKLVTKQQLAKKSKPLSTNGKPLKQEKQKEGQHLKNGETKGSLSAAKPKAKLKVYQPLAREVIYTESEVRLHTKAEGNALTASYAKELLGWREESEGIKFGGDGEPPVHLTDLLGKKVHCLNNTSNRYLRMSHVLFLMQEILRGRWQLNGEPCIVGTTGQILDNQHTLIALVLAVQEWHKNQGPYKDVWPQEPCIDKVLVCGIEETDAVVNTINTGKTRVLWDVLYRSIYFSKLKHKDRIACSKLADYAIRLLWSRTGACGSLDKAKQIKRSHAEALDFIDRHERVLECVRHVYEENGTDNRLLNIVTPGYASALMYLMAASATEREEKGGYSMVDTPSEEQIDFSNWDKAEEFWVLLCSKHQTMFPVTQAVSALMNEPSGITLGERLGIICKAWNCWSADDSFTAKDLNLEYATAENDTEPSLVECPNVGGIDLGDYGK